MTELIEILLACIVFAAFIFVGPGLLLVGAYWLWERKVKP